MGIRLGSDALPDEWRDLARQQREHHDAENRGAGEAPLPRPSRPDDDESGAHRRYREDQIARDEYFMIDVPERAVGATPVHEHVIHVETEAPGQDQQHDAGEHGEVAPHVSRDVEPAAIPTQARRQGIQEDDERGDDQQRDERPVIQRLLERQPVDEESEIASKIGIRFIEQYA